MNANKSQARQPALFTGSIVIPDLPYTNLQILHKLASDLNIDGCTVRKISVFEDPLTANIQIETNSSTQTHKPIFLFSKHPKIIDFNQRLYLDLSLRVLNRLSNCQNLIYCIKVGKIQNKTSAATSIVKDAWHVKEQLFDTFKRLTTPKG